MITPITGGKTLPFFAACLIKVQLFSIHKLREVHAPIVTEWWVGHIEYLTYRKRICKSKKESKARQNLVIVKKKKQRTVP